jgi:hypothetical protein
MRTPTILQLVFCLAIAGVLTPAQALTQQELVTMLEAAGYSHVEDMKSTPEGIVVRATKDGKDVRLVVDSSGQIKKRD